MENYPSLGVWGNHSSRHIWEKVFHKPSFSVSSRSGDVLVRINSGWGRPRSLHFPHFWLSDAIHRVPTSRTAILWCCGPWRRRRCPPWWWGARRRHTVCPSAAYGVPVGGILVGIAPFIAKLPLILIPCDSYKKSGARRSTVSLISYLILVRFVTNPLVPIIKPNFLKNWNEGFYPFF